MKKYLVVTALAIAGVAAAACGSTTTHATGSNPPAATQSTTTTTPPPPKPLKLDAPSDRTVAGEQYVLKGTATLGSSVSVNADGVRLRHGHWSKSVSLTHGENDFSINENKPGHDDVSADVVITRKWTPAEREAQRQAREAARQAREARAAAQVANYKGRAVTIPYNELNKDADAQAGKIVTYTGQIFQIQEDSASGGGIMLLSVTNDGYGFWTDNVWVNYRGHISQNEGDSITVWGKVEGSKSYDTQVGGTTYVPEVTAKYVS